MRIKAKCDYVRVVNFFSSSYEDFSIPTPSRVETSKRSKRVERLQRILEKKEAMHRLHEQYCVGRSEIEIGILYGVGIARTPEIMFEEFMEKDSEFNAYTVRKIRSSFPPSFARKINGNNANKRKNTNTSGRSGQEYQDLRKQKIVYNNTVGKRSTPTGYRSY